MPVLTPRFWSARDGKSSILGPVRRLLFENWGYKLLSLVLAVLLYLFVRGERRDARLPVPVAPSAQAR